MQRTTYLVIAAIHRHVSQVAPVFFIDRVAWRRWLERNHSKAREVWILTFKKHTGKQCVSYSDALDEALCYGWIDSRMKRIDDEKHMWRFAPRKLNSIWSLSNRKRAEKLIKERRMTRHGLAKIKAAKKNGQWDRAIAPSRPPRMPKGLRDALMKDGIAWTNFRSFAKSYRTQYIYWVLTAKQDETKERRIAAVVERARHNKKPYVP